ncbi:MAG: AbrB/MazE/SpoVT family DNA-binding domain-containing protein [Granulicella sp.]
MSGSRFTLQIGARRQVTIPARMMELLDLQENGELLCEIHDDQVTLTPILKVLRTDLPQELRQRFLARRGAKSTDLELDSFLDILAQGAAQPAQEAAPDWTQPIERDRAALSSPEPATDRAEEPAADRAQPTSRSRSSLNEDSPRRAKSEA